MAPTRRGEGGGDEKRFDGLLESWGFRWLGNGVLLQELAHKTIAATGKGLHISGFGCAVPQRGSNLVYGEVDAMFEVDKGGVLPETALDLFTAHKLVGMLDQKCEHSERLWLELQQPPCFAQFT